MRTRMSISLSCLLFLFVVAFISYAMQPKSSYFLAVDAKLLEKTQSIASPTPSKIPTEKKEQKIVTQKKGVILSPTPVVATTNHASDDSSSATQNPTTNEPARGGSDTTQVLTVTPLPTQSLDTQAVTAIREPTPVPTSGQQNIIVTPKVPNPKSPNTVIVSGSGSSTVPSQNAPGNVGGDVYIYTGSATEQPKVGNSVSVQSYPIPTTQ